MTAVIAGIQATAIAVEQVAPEPAPVELLETVHERQYIDDLERFCLAGGGALDLDTVAGLGSWEAALRTAGAGALLCDRLASGAAQLGYVAMRPPGHHAGRRRAMGFCLFNNVAITAAHLIARGNRVAILDWDVHHGNGTQDLFYATPEVLYVSIHQEGIYPGTGGSDEVGTGDAIGTTLNIPVPSQTGGDFYRRAMAAIVVPVISQFAPDWLLVSSGYDAHRDDHLASLKLVAGDYGAMAQAVAPVMAPGRTVIFLEGGYDLDGLRTSAAATVEGWLDPGYEIDPVTEGIDAADRLRAAREAAARHWELS